MRVTLKMTAFKGADAGETKRRAEAFLAETGLKVLDYQDNEAVRAARVLPPPLPSGPLESLAFAARKARLLRELRAQPNVWGTAEIKAPLTGGFSIRVYFDPYVYPEEARRLSAVLPEGWELDFQENPEMKGIWARLDVSGLADPAAAARELVRRRPEQVADARIMMSVEVIRIEGEVGVTMRQRLSAIQERLGKAELFGRSADGDAAH